MTTSAVPPPYVPSEGYLWDPWFHTVGDVVHLFHLLQKAPRGMDRAAVYPRDRPVIAHATWTGREGWVSRGTAVDYTGTTYDEDRIHTGCIVEGDDSFHMLYSGSNRFICQATSDDLDRWTKAAGNPVLRPDPARYLDRWRDPWVTDGLAGERYTMVIAAQQRGARDHPTGVVGVAHSHDLLAWHQDDPLVVPPWFTWLEVPELHQLDGLWYLLFATRRAWITEEGRIAIRARGLDAVDGAYYLVAPSWRGPYGSIGRLTGTSESPGYTTRLVRRSPAERWLWSHVEHDGGGRPVFGLASPRLYASVPGGGLVGVA